MDITKRQKQILFAIIEEYAEVAAPVGSVTLAKLFDVSSATIRAEMARLEEMGLIRSHILPLVAFLQMPVIAFTSML